MALIYNETTGGHDIKSKGILRHQLKKSDFDDIEGSISTKQNGAALKANTVLKDGGEKIQIRVLTETPLTYALWHGSTEVDPPEDWWRSEQEVD